MLGSNGAATTRQGQRRARQYWTIFSSQYFASSQSPSPRPAASKTLPKSLAKTLTTTKCGRNRSANAISE